MLAVVPGLMSPTAAVTVPLGCAIVVFIYYNRFGLKKHGVGGYAKTLLGPVPAISPIMFVVETFSHFARLLSLTVRLWANMMVSELIFVSFLGLSIGLFTFLGHLNAAGYVSAIVPVGIPLGADVLSYFRSGAAGVHFYDSFHRVSGTGDRRGALIRNYKLLPA